MTWGGLLQPSVIDDLGWGGEATRGAQGCGGGYPPLGLLERDVKFMYKTGILLPIC